MALGQLQSAPRKGGDVGVGRAGDRHQQRAAQCARCGRGLRAAPVPAVHMSEAETAACLAAAPTQGKSSANSTCIAPRVLFKSMRMPKATRVLCFCSLSLI